MPEREWVSFRVVHPDPFDFFQKLDLPLELHCAAEFSSKAQAVQLHRTLLSLGYIHHLQLKNSKPFRTTWALAWSQAALLLQPLKAFPRLLHQVEEGLRGYSRDHFWKLKGRGGRTYAWHRQTQVMGILNATPDSFSDGGRYLDPSLAADRALRMQEEGATWIDVGGESTRPGAKPVPASEEKKRILPVLRACVKVLRVPISVDTYKAEVARAAVGEGAQMINDISALRFDRRMGPTVAKLKVPVLLMHMRGNPRTMQKKPVYQDAVGEILRFFRAQLQYAQDCGISKDRLLIDPGFGFGKTDDHNLELLRRLWEFKVLDRPIVSGPSRKGTLGRLLGGLPPRERVEATAAAVTVSVLKGADFVRVHDVKSMARVVKIADAIRYDRG